MSPRIGERVYVRQPRQEATQTGVVRALSYKGSNLTRVHVVFDDGSSGSIPPGRVEVSLFSQLFRPLR